MDEASGQKQQTARNGVGRTATIGVPGCHEGPEVGSRMDGVVAGRDCGDAETTVKVVAVATIDDSTFEDAGGGTTWSAAGACSDRVDTSSDSGMSAFALTAAVVVVVGSATPGISSAVKS